MNNGYGIGVIKLNLENPLKSEIVVSARERSIVDINFMNFLADMNKDFYSFVDNARKAIKTKKVDAAQFDKIM